MKTNLLEFRHVVQKFGRKPALVDVDFVVPRSSLTVLLGPAGAGKTTTLRVIAGLETPQEGAVILDGHDLGQTQPRDRNVAMIFDNLALYPHYTGFENIAHPLRVAKMAAGEIRQKVGEVARLLKIEHVLHRLPKTLSGGERQRIALGRAMVREPLLYLLDEPLSSLDAMLRLELRAELRRLQRDLGKTFLFATPDYSEALAIADTVVVLFDGKVRQVAPPQVLYDEPVDRDVATFVGSPQINIVDARFVPEEGGRVMFGQAHVGAPASFASRVDGEAFQIGLRPEHMSIAPMNGKPVPLAGQVIDVEPLGLHATVQVRVGDVDLTTTVSGEQDDRFRRGDRVAVSLDLNRAHVFAKESGRRIV